MARKRKMFDWLFGDEGEGSLQAAPFNREPEPRGPFVHEFDPAPFETRAAFLAHLKEKGAQSRNGGAHVVVEGEERWDRAMIAREQAGWKDWPHEKLFAYVEERGKKPDPVFDQSLTSTIVAWARGGLPRFHSGSYGASTWVWEKAESVIAKARQNLLIDAEIRKNVLRDPHDAPVYPEPWKQFRVKFEGSWYVVAAIGWDRSHPSGSLTYVGLNNRPLITFGTGQWSAALPEGTTP